MSRPFQRSQSRRFCGHWFLPPSGAAFRQACRGREGTPESVTRALYLPELPLAHISAPRGRHGQYRLGGSLRETTSQVLPRGLHPLLRPPACTARASCPPAPSVPCAGLETPPASAARRTLLARDWPLVTAGRGRGAGPWCCPRPDPRCASGTFASWP